ncbi:MAG TPA: hypothetical protein VMH81_21910 [Bryobacteraceae bacterium]|nr:hypothetical protein [Bryobacteraceae bacterium]
MFYGRRVGRRHASDTREGPAPNGINHPFGLHLVYYQWTDIAQVLDQNAVGFVAFDPAQAGRTNPLIHPPAIPQTFPTKLFNPATDY